MNHRWRDRNLDIRFAPDAVVYWRLRPDLATTWAQYFRYARGDAVAGLYPERHAVRFAVYGSLLVVLASGRTWPKVLAAAGAVAYARTPTRRAWARLREPRQRAAATAAVPALLALTDAAKMAGYAVGLALRSKRRPPAA